jgi:hypothetical protein
MAQKGGNHMLNLDGPRLKIRRAKSEIECFSHAEEIFRQNTKYYIIRTNINPKSGNYIYRVRQEGPPPPLDWGIDIGEIIHNLRSALDYLVYQLALLKSNTHTVGTQFPIFILGKTIRKIRGNEIPCFKNRHRKMIGGLSSKHKAMIERLQPYHRWNRNQLSFGGRRRCGPRNSPIWWLHEINNADKHRIIQVVAIKPAGMSAGYWGDIMPSIKFNRCVLKNGAKIAECSPEVNMYPTIDPLIAFDDRCGVVARLGVYYVLNEIARTVDSIVDKFAV